MLNSKELKQYITNIEPDNEQQVGIDMNIVGVEFFEAQGFAGVKDKELPTTKKIEKAETFGGFEVYHLKQGAYIITLQQGCKLPDNVAFRLKERSTLMRCGATIDSPWFDPGYYSAEEPIKTLMLVHNPYGIAIEHGARVCQAVGWECTPTKAYNGQYQNEKPTELDIKRFNKKDY